MRILISILSKYLQPNFLLIKEFERRYDKLVFITTALTEKGNKTTHLCNALGISINLVDLVNLEDKEDNYRNIVSIFENKKFSKTDEYILNLTGGTKIISLAVYEFFMNNGYNADFYYVPEGKNIIKNLSSSEESDLKYRLNLKEYFLLNGLYFQHDNSLLYDANFTKNFFEYVKQKKFRIKNVRQIENAHNPENSSIDKRYYSGAWFEEYCYLKLKEENQIEDDCICKSAKIYRNMNTSNDNEIDVMFIKNNQLYVFECKVTMFGNGNPKDTIDNYLYKLAAISKDYGLKVKSYILTLHNVRYSLKDNGMNNLEKRKKILGISELLDASSFNKIGNLKIE